jgi:tetratricopeptide (TPR) repeat protein
MGETDTSTRTGRPRGIPPPPLPRVEFDVLKADEGVLGVALWHSVRIVLLWAGTPPDNRPGLFRPVGESVRERYAHACLAAPELADALGIFAFLQQAPEVVEAGPVAAACHAVYRWADRRGLLATAAHFAEAAAYAQPTNATWAVDAGWICRRLGGVEMLERSTAWYLRAYGLAARAKDRKETLRSLTGYGALMKDLGRLDDARAAYEQSARRALRTGRARRAAVAYHYLFALAVETGNLEEAFAHADRALTLYPIHDSRIPFLLHDFAYQLVRLHHYRHALRLLESAAGRLDRPHELGLFFGTMAQAAGGARRPDRYRAAERAALRLIAINEEHAAAALECLAEGARSLEDWGRAEKYALKALEVARARSDSVEEQLVLALLEVVERREPGAPAEDPPPTSRAAMLARRFAARLRRWRRHGPGGL